MNEINPIPAGIVIDVSGASPRIVRRWTSKAWSSLIFCLLWNGPIFFLYSKEPLSEKPMILLVFLLIFFGVGLCLIYHTVCSCLNCTTIEFWNGIISVRHGPLPWPGNVDMESQKLTQVHGRKSSEIRIGFIKRYRYSLIGVLKDGRQVLLVGGELEKDQALFIAKEIQKRLGLNPGSSTPMVGNFLSSL
jgi:hypothetical protein